MNYNSGETHYIKWSENLILSDCLRELGFGQLADKIHTDSLNNLIITCYINLIEEESKKQKNLNVLERLYFAGLIYG